MNMTNYNLKKTEYCEAETLEDLIKDIAVSVFIIGISTSRIENEDSLANIKNHLKTYIDNLIRQRNDEMTANFKIS
jgi:hypothetical protein